MPVLRGSFRADAIKREARKHAWYQNDSEETRTYNIFGRQSRRPARPQDEENGLQQVSTEGSVPSPIETSRRQEMSRGVEDFGGPQKSNTFSEGPTGPVSDARGKMEDSETSKDSTEKPESGETNMRSVQTSDEAKPRQRRNKFMPWKKTEDPDVERTHTSESRKSKAPKITVGSQLKVVFLSWINILLVFVPVGIALHFTKINQIVVFVMNFIAIIPLAGMLSYATEELALYVGETIGGLLNASFGNAVELIVGIIALSQRQILIVQTSLIGSMLSNLLLVMGMCFFFGGLKRTEQFFNITVAQTASSLLALAIGSLIIPTAFQIFANNDKGVTPTSRGTAVLLLVTYGCYLFFQLRTHVDMYNEPSQKSPKKPSGKKEAGEARRSIAAIGAGSGAALAGGQINQENLVQEEEEGPETPQLTQLGALLTLAGSTALVALCADFMVSAIGAVSKDVSPEFIGLILLPIVGNAAEHATAVTVAIKDKMDLAIGVAVGSSLQIALLVLPIMVMLNWWGVGSPADMTLDFDGFQVSVLFIAIIMVNYVIQDGKSQWLEGVLLMITYLIIAVSAWFYPPPNGADVAG